MLSLEAEFAGEVADPSRGSWTAKIWKLGFRRVWLAGRPALREEDLCSTRGKEVWRFWSRWCWWNWVQNLSMPQSELMACVEATPSKCLVAMLGDSHPSASDTVVTLIILSFIPCWESCSKNQFPLLLHQDPQLPLCWSPSNWGWNKGSSVPCSDKELMSACWGGVLISLLHSKLIRYFPKCFTGLELR